VGSLPPQKVASGEIEAAIMAASAEEMDGGTCEVPPHDSKDDELGLEVKTFCETKWRKSKTQSAPGEVSPKTA